MKSWAIVVGINAYPKQADQGPLQGAVADACDFADWALDPAGGGVAPEHLYFWTHPWPDSPQGRLEAYIAGGPPPWSNVDLDWAAPDRTRAPGAFEITSTIEAVGRSACTQAMEDGDAELRRVYVFLAGHGIRAMTFNRTEETCFVAGDFRPLRNGDLAAGLVPCDSFKRALLNKRFNEAILFTDCCRAQTARLTLTAQPVSDYAGDPIEPHSIAYAAQVGSLAHETTTAPVRGAFSSTLMRGLRSYRTGASSDLYAGSLKQYLLDNIKHFTDTGQKPSMSFLPDGDGPLIVRGAPTHGDPLPVGRIIDVSRLPHGTQLVLHGGDNAPVPGIPPLVVTGPTIETPPLTPGLYSIEVADGSGRYAVFKHPGTEHVHVG